MLVVLHKWNKGALILDVGLCLTGDLPRGRDRRGHEKVEGSHRYAVEG